VQHAVFETAHPSSDPSDASSRRPDTVRLSLKEGARLGAYQILTALGSGGMGEVYKARDMRLDRTVALKVLPRDLAANPAARQRFEREARAVAALSHPHICPLFDIGRQNEIDYLVMEYVDGETLASRLARGKLPLEQALTYAIEIAEAVDAAHAAGIVHRDLKPGNVMLTKNGAKLLDFGLAKRQPHIVTGDLTRLESQPVTRAGMILGTVQYMAPEQLEGKSADARTDVFAFGAVLYEMITGRRAFEGTSDASLIGNILHAEPPPLATLAPMAPAALDETVRRCLAKEPNARWPSMAEVHAQVLAARALVANDGAGARRATTFGKRRATLPVTAIGAMLLLLALAVVVWRSLPRTPTTSAEAERAPVQRSLTRLTFDQGLQTDPTFSPDGRFIAYASDKSGNFDIWVQSVAGGDAVQVTKSPAHETQPDWSPDGATIVFRSSKENGGLFAAPALGGIERRVAEFGFRPRFSPDGSRILFVDSLAFEEQRINPNAYVIAAAGGAPSRVGRAIWPTLGWIKALDWSPNGRISILSVPGGAARADRDSETVDVQVVSLSYDGDDVVQSSIEAGVRSLLGSCGQIPEFRWTASGRRVILVCDAGTTRNIWSVGTDPATLAWTGPVERLTAGAEFDHRVALSRAGVAAFSNQVDVTRLWQFSIDDDSGRSVSSGAPLTSHDFDVATTVVSPDGRTVVYSGQLIGARQWQVWKASLDSASRELHISDTRGRFLFRAAPDGSVCYVRRDEDGRFRVVYTSLADSAEHVVAEDPQLILPFDWTPSGDGIIGSASVEKRPFSIVQWPLKAAPHAERAARVILSDERFNLWNARYSPNGKWMCLSANTGDQGGVSVVGVTAAEGSPQRPWLHLTPDADWSDHPRWSSSGSVLFYVTGYRQMSPNVWAIPFDQVRGTPMGEPRPVTKFDSPARGVSHDINVPIDVGKGRLVAPVTETSGHIWMLDNVDK
jgi:serine/threonine protein kinase/Tol biopolymer transport system component